MFQMVPSSFVCGVLLLGLGYTDRATKHWIFYIVYSYPLAVLQPSYKAYVVSQVLSVTN